MKQKKLYLVRAEYIILNPYVGGGRNFYVVTNNNYKWIRDRIKSVLHRRHPCVIKAIKIYPQDGEVITG